MNFFIQSSQTHVINFFDIALSMASLIFVLKNVHPEHIISGFFFVQYWWYYTVFVHKLWYLFYYIANIIMTKKWNHRLQIPHWLRHHDDQYQYLAHSLKCHHNFFYIICVEQLVWQKALCGVIYWMKNILYILYASVSFVLCRISTAFKCIN